MAADILAGIATGIREAAGEVAGLALITAVVAVLAWYGRRQEVRRAAERRARAEARRRPPALDPAELPDAVDPWPDADDDHEMFRLNRWDVLLPAGVW
ncbi:MULTISPECIES: hypothetical protein [Micromonospora]|uniref:hypothetical protein n=1 Tax=Micromonospora TaxID=1873 RepID=UPI0004C02922|nr:MULTISPECIES: hypothetical protein [Micromonospora]